jgi:predicted acylesterase/phospholipase RssA
MRINGELYADGALVANNPTGVAIHETKKLFPNVPLELVVRSRNNIFVSLLNTRMLGIHWNGKVDVTRLT